jgi:hypothetical protein
VLTISAVFGLVVGAFVLWRCGCWVTGHAWEPRKPTLGTPAHFRCVVCRRRVLLDVVLRGGR